MKLEKKKIQNLIRIAADARKFSYAPYSHFAVGAALLGADAKIYTGWSFKPIDVICITHFHADHISGLPGMLLTMGNAERTEPLTMIGPKGLEHVVNSLRIIAPELPFEIKFIELEQPEEVIEICGLRIRAFRVNHRVTCYGYNIELDRAGKFDAARARALGLPVQYWSLLQKGETVDYEGNVYTSDMVMGSPRKGLKVTYCTDTRPVDAIAECAKDAG